MLAGGGRGGIDGLSQLIAEEECAADEGTGEPGRCDNPAQVAATVKAEAHLRAVGHENPVSDLNALEADDRPQTLELIRHIDLPFAAFNIQRNRLELVVLDR